ncbi:MAG: VWA domain-containing protein [Acidobacteriota bacterium]|nr:VWA domain-containing protein [Acidobacteriota bacterium]
MMNRNLTAGLLFGVAWLASHPWVRAEQAAQQPSSNTQAAADEMPLYLVVRDKHDKPVLDLKSEDLNITDDGSPVRLWDLQLSDHQKQAANLVTFVFDPVPAQEGHLSKNAARVSNAHEAALKILSLLSESGFKFSVFNVDTRLHLQQTFTSDLSAVEKAIDSATGPLTSRDKKEVSAAEKAIISVALSGVDASGKRVNARDRLLARSVYSALRNSTQIAQDRHISPSLPSILALVQSQQDLTGRKTIVYLSSMQQSQINDAAKQAIDSIIGSANQAGIGIDVIDCNSLGPHGSRIKVMDPNTQGALVALNTKALPGGSISIAPDQSTLEVMEDAPVTADLKHLAVATGGTYLNGDGQRKSLQQLIGDMTSYYEASFIPKMNGYDGKFHPLVVNSVRPSLRIRTQTGYLALPPPTEDGSRPQPFELPLLQLLRQSPLPSALPFHAAILNMGDRAEGRMSELAIEVPVKNLDVQKDTNTPTSVAHLSMIAYISDQTGGVAAHFSTNTPRRLSLNRADEKDAGVIELQRHFVLPPGQYTLKVLVQDDTSGKAGAQTIPFTISGEAVTPSLSNIVLVRRTDPARAAEDQSDPLSQGKVRVTPNLSGALSSGESKISIFFSGHADPHAAQPARLQISIIRDGKVLGGAPAITREVSGEEYFSLLTNFSIGSPQDGTYQVEALLTQGGKTAESNTFFALSDVGSEDPDPSTSSVNLETVSRPAGPLAITVSNNSVQRPPDDEVKALIADATRYAADYWDSLPNFTCENQTERFVSSNGEGKWEHADTLIGRLTYFDRQEDWQFLDTKKNHRNSHDGSSFTEKGISSAGIFGGVIRGLFRPASKAEIVWTATDVLGNGTVEVFKYRIAQENSSLNLRVGPTEVVTVGYHGLVYIDSTTHGVRRITEIADSVPRKFPIHEAFVSADYDYVSIGDRNYLLPIGAQVILRRGSHRLDLSQIQFRSFHRFGSTSKILSFTPDTKE